MKHAHTNSKFKFRLFIRIIIGEKEIILLVPSLFTLLRTIIKKSHIGQQGISLLKQVYSRSLSMDNLTSLWFIKHYYWREELSQHIDCTKKDLSYVLFNFGKFDFFLAGLGRNQVSQWSWDANKLQHPWYIFQNLTSFSYL